MLACANLQGRDACGRVRAGCRARGGARGRASERAPAPRRRPASTVSIMLERSAAATWAAPHMHGSERRRAGARASVRGGARGRGGWWTQAAGGVPDRAAPSPREAQPEVAGLRWWASARLSCKWAGLRASQAWQTGVVGVFERSRSRSWLLSSGASRALLGLVQRAALAVACARVDIIPALHGLRTGIHALGGWSHATGSRVGGR